MSQTRKNLVLGDYVTVHVSDFGETKRSRRFGPPADILEKHASFFMRIVKERKELSVAQPRKAA